MRSLHFRRSVQIAYSLACAILLFASLPSSGLPFVADYEEYAEWPKANQIEYIREWRHALTEFELRSQAGIEFAENNSQPAWLEAFAAILPTSDASGDQQYCVVGGRERKLKRFWDGREMCPTSGLPCAPYGNDGFECGTVYNGVCVSRYPVGSITRRCETQSGRTDHVLPKQEYEEKKQAIQSVMESCNQRAVDQRYAHNCEEFVRSAAEIGKKYVDVASGNPPTEPAAQPEQSAQHAEKQSGKFTNRFTPPPPQTPASVPRYCEPGAKNEFVIHRNDGDNVTSNGMSLIKGGLVWADPDYPGVTAFDDYARAVADTGKRIIVEGECKSACLLFIGRVPKDRVCVSPDSKLGFHKIRTGPQRDAPWDPEATEKFYSEFRPDIKRWIGPLKNLPDGDVKYLEGKEMLSLFNTCQQQQQKCDQIIEASRGQSGDAPSLAAEAVH